MLRRDLGGQGLTAALHADQEDSFRRAEVEGPGLLGKPDRGTLEPSLQGLESAQLESIVLQGIVFKQPPLTDDLHLPLYHGLDGLRGQASVLDDGMRYGLPRLIQREPSQRPDQLLLFLVREQHVSTQRPVQRPRDGL